MHFSKKFLAILFLGVSVCFETGAIIGSFFWPVSSFWVRAVEKKIGRKNFVPILSVWARKSFETLAIIVIFRKKKQRKKRAQKKRGKKKFQSVLFPCLRAAPWFCWCSRLASLAQSSLGPAQYRRWAFIQLCISELIIADPFCYHIISLPSSTYIYVVRLTLPGNRSIQALKVLTTTVADHRLLLGKNW